MPRHINKIQDAPNLKGKVVLLRVDFNVLDKKGRIESDFRIKSSLPTIKLLVKKGAKVVIAAHAGRPDGKVVPTYSLKTVAARLSKMLKKKVPLAPDCVGPKVQALILKMKPGQILMLENLRFHKGEEENDTQFAMRLALLADVYVNDAFGVSHRANASVEAITRRLKSYAGLLMQKEIVALSKVRDNPDKPMVILIGGAKASDKIPVITSLIKHADKVLLGGAASNTFLKAHHYNIGVSLYEPEQVDNARKILHANLARIVMPKDVVVCQMEGDGYNFKTIRETSIDDVHEKEAVLDIADYTYKTFAGYIREASTIFWAGPLGHTDYVQFSHGTYEVAKALASSKAFTVVGGGETVAALEKFKLLGKMKHVSTGGGASLEFLSGKPLSGIEALTKSK